MMTAIRQRFWLWVFLLGTPMSLCADGLDAGPLWADFELTLRPGNRVEAVGPFFDREVNLDYSSWSFHPLFHYREYERADITQWEFLYPVLTYDRFGEQYKYQFLYLFKMRGGLEISGEKENIGSLWPFLFWENSEKEGENFFAFFPFGGTLKDRLFRDQINFYLFPAYAKTWKRDIETTNILYPIWHWRTGDHLKGWQFWPFYGTESRTPFMRENNWGDEEFVPGHEKRFVAWPIYFNTREGIGTDNPEHAVSVLPFYRQFRSPQRDATSVLWPFFTYIDDREEQFREHRYPWPFIVFARGEGKYVDRVLPFYGYGKTDTQEARFVLWPIYRYNRTVAPPLDRKRTRILFFLFSDIEEKNLESGTTRKRQDFWPLYTLREDELGNRRFQAFAPLEPFFGVYPTFERNWSPLWSVWRTEYNGQNEAKSQSFLWNLYRRQTTTESSKTTVLFGLFDYEKQGDKKRWKLFYIPFGDKLDQAVEADEESEN